MHEISLVQNIIEIVKQEMDHHHVDKLKAIHLSVGRLSAVVPEQMTLCFEVLTKNTKLAGTELKMKMVPVTYRCRMCNQEFISEWITFNCTSCNGENPELILGRELKIEFIEVRN
jgi:hydrogenase nickel incorporation protein HypA/HybF